MKFNVLEGYWNTDYTPIAGEAYLRPDRWNDFTFVTLFHLDYIDDSESKHEIGQVKIAHKGMSENDKKTVLPSIFEMLGASHFSLGQDDTYYEKIKNLGEEARELILRSLRDVAFDEALMDEVETEQVMIVSLLRSVNIDSVVRQFRPMALGGDRLTPYEFTYKSARALDVASEPIVFSFQVAPGSHPPTNIHALIGSNGAGKTTILREMRSLLTAPRNSPIHSQDAPKFEDAFGETSSAIFLNLVSVSFSVFDQEVPDEGVSAVDDAGPQLRFNYIGIKNRAGGGENLSDHELAAAFAKGAEACTRPSHRERWRKALETVQMSYVYDIASRACERSQTHDDPSRIFRKGAERYFQRLSSGHKIILLVITRLVELTAERSLVLIDEPETHLHPPLLASFTRALSDLLVDRNGVAIIATHSPVVAQEVPRSCVWKIRRHDEIVDIDRPDIESFGEGVGVLTHEVFGLEVRESGFYAQLRDLANDGLSLEEILGRFNDTLGGEARSIARVLANNRRQGHGD